MREKLRFLGLDVDAETIAVAIADGEVRSLGTIPNCTESIRKLLKKLGSGEKLRACYEAGPTSYVVYWQLRSWASSARFSAEVSYEIATHATDDPLTPAEISVLRLIAAGYANKQIAGQLSITEETVKSRVKCILSKLGANDRTQAPMIGLKRGIIDL